MIPRPGHPEGDLSVLDLNHRLRREPQPVNLRRFANIQVGDLRVVVFTARCVWARSPRIPMDDYGDAHVRDVEWFMTDAPRDAFPSTCSSLFRLDVVVSDRTTPSARCAL